MTDHSCCRTMLARARDAARRLKVKIPPGLSALRCDRRQFFVEARENSPRVYLKACCVADAKAKFIFRLIEPEMEAAYDRAAKNGQL